MTPAEIYARKEDELKNYGCSTRQRVLTHGAIGASETLNTIIARVSPHLLTTPTNLLVAVPEGSVEPMFLGAIMGNDKYFVVSMLVAK